ncbi:hypothetical protein HUJ04_011111, partial [Dendroctonus ponderosae]
MAYCPVMKLINQQLLLKVDNASKYIAISENRCFLIKGTQKVKDLYASMTDVVGLHCLSQILQWSVSLVCSMFTSKGDNVNDYARLAVGIIYIFLML